MATDTPFQHDKDRPWIFRTYAGHSTAKASNQLYRDNLARGQTGLSVAFDLPTQTGYDSDHVLSAGEVGKVGVPICHLGDMQQLFENIPLEQMNTSMTINATAPWLLALYIAAADEQGADRTKLQGTVQNDIIKEYLSRGTYVLPPKASLQLKTDVISYTYTNIPKWNPTNVCSYHLQEAGATPVQELAYALATAVAVLDRVKEGGQVPEADFARVVGRISFFVNAGVRFITEIAKMRAFVDLWDVIMIEMLAVTLSKDARARAVQLPAWNEALGLPRPWDQQWSLRAQQILAYETDLLEYEDIFDGSHVMEKKVAELKAAAKEEMRTIEEMGGAVVAVENAYMKERLVESNAARFASIEEGSLTVVGVNKYQQTVESPLTAGEESIMIVPEGVAEEQVARLQAWREKRDDAAVKAALADLRQAAKEGRNVMEPSIVCAKAGVTTGEWGDVLRGVFGEYRAPTGVAKAARNNPAPNLDPVREAVSAVSLKLGRQMKLLVGKPGLDGHSNGAEQIAVRARDTGMDVVYEGIRLTPEQIVNAAEKGDVHIVGLSILSGSHVPLVEDVMVRMREAGLSHIPVIVGGIIPPEDEATLEKAGVSAIYTPKDFDLNKIMLDLVVQVDPEQKASTS
jgi:(2R)-ethylmalonyl-CoA mutase